MPLAAFRTTCQSRPPGDGITIVLDRTGFGHIMDEFDLEINTSVKNNDEADGHENGQIPQAPPERAF